MAGPGDEHDEPVDDEYDEPADDIDADDALDDEDGAEADTDATDDEDAEDDGPTIVDGGGWSPTRLAAAVGAILLIVAVVGVFVVRSGEEEAGAPTTAPATAPPTVTTTTEVQESPTESLVASARVPNLQVLAAPPPEWELSTPVRNWAPEDPPPTSAALYPDRPPLPRKNFPIDGRYVTDTGWSFSSPTAFDGPFTLLVTEQRGDWLKVMVPVRPNGTEGYVKASDVDLAAHHHRLELRVGERMLRAYDGDELIAETQVVVGKDTTRTPLGRFYVTDKVPQGNPDGTYGPVALATSGYSEQLDIFDNGVPVIAMHGTNQPELIGQNVSNGCIRVPNEVILQLAQELPLGTPLDIYA